MYFISLRQQNFFERFEKKKLANGALKRIKWRVPLFGWTLYYTKNKMLNKKRTIRKEFFVDDKRVKSLFQVIQTIN